MSFEDDDPIVAPQDDSGVKPTAFIAGKTQLRFIKKDEAPIEETKFKVMLELMGAGSSNDRSGVDIVAVLDISESMSGPKLKKLKNAMRFVIKKLSKIDRLSVVTFNDVSQRLCPLRQITDNSEAEIEELVNSIQAKGNTNISAGLETALEVIDDRRLTTNRNVGILLMSDGVQNRGGDASEVDVEDVPVFTFGFGKDQGDKGPKVLQAIAENSKGGTFSDVQMVDNISIAFSQCLAGLLTVVVQDLTLTVTRESQSTIKEVSAGSYPKTTDNAAVTVTISFGDLYANETRKVIVDLLLPKVNDRVSEDILEVRYTYRTLGRLFEANPLFAGVIRTKASVENEKQEVMTEVKRIETARKMKAARELAEEKNFDEALDKLDEAKVMLVDAAKEPLIEMLQYELQQLSKFLASDEVYKKQGRPFALSSETSHDRQRFAARGDVGKLRLFATPRMNEYLEQAKLFDQDPTKPPPKVDEDVKKELAANPLAPIVGALAYYIQTAIQALKSIDSILTTSR